MTKYCPLRSNTCNEECAWWIVRYIECSIQTIASGILQNKEAIIDIGNKIKDIEKVMRILGS